MIALLVALSLATPASHGHRPAHAHKHRHKHKPVHVNKHKSVHANRCITDARQVQALEVRMSRGGVPTAELNMLQSQLESAIERARQDCH